MRSSMLVCGSVIGGVFVMIEDFNIFIRQESDINEINKLMDSYKKCRELYKSLEKYKHSNAFYLEVCNTTISNDDHKLMITSVGEYNHMIKYRSHLKDRVLSSILEEYLDRDNIMMIIKDKMIQLEYQANDIKIEVKRRLEDLNN